MQKETRAQKKRRERDEQIKKLWIESGYTGESKNKVLIAEEIMLKVDASLTTVLRVIKPLI